MIDKPFRFIRKDGHVIPIRAPGVGRRATGSAAKAARKTKLGRAAWGVAKVASVGAAAVTIHKARNERRWPWQSKTVPVNKTLDRLGLGISVLSGAIGAATFHKGWKGVAGGAALSYGVDAFGVAANAASVAGHGRVRERAKQGAYQEVRNIGVGNAVMFGGILAHKAGRDALKVYGNDLAKGTQKAVQLVKRVVFKR